MYKVPHRTPVLRTTCNRCTLYYRRTAVDRRYRSEPGDDTAGGCNCNCNSNTLLSYKTVMRIMCSVRYPRVYLFYFCPRDIWRYIVRPTDTGVRDAIYMRVLLLHRIVLSRIAA